MKLKKKSGVNATHVDKSPIPAQLSRLPWWRSEAGVRSKGDELGLPAAPGESSGHYKNRLFKALDELRLKGQR